MRDTHIGEYDYLIYQYIVLRFLKDNKYQYHNLQNTRDNFLIKNQNEVFAKLNLIIFTWSLTLFINTLKYKILNL